MYIHVGQNLGNLWIPAPLHPSGGLNTAELKVKEYKPVKCCYKMRCSCIISLFLRPYIIQLKALGPLPLLQPAAAVSLNRRGVARSGGLCGIFAVTSQRMFPSPFNVPGIDLELCALFVAFGYVH